MFPRRGTAPPRGTRTWPLCRAPRSGSAPSSRGRGWPHFSRQGVRAARPSLSHSVGRGRSDGPRDGRGRQAFGAARSRWGRGANWGAGPGSAPAGVGQPGLCLSVSWLVRLSAPQGSGAVQSPGESAPRSPAAAGAWEARQRRGHPRLSRGPPRLVESHGYPRGSLVGAEQEARAAAAVSSSAASSKSHPRALLSLSGCWKARGQRGRATGEAAPRRAEGGVSSLGMGKARRGSGLECGPTLQAAPGAGHLSGAPCLLPPGSDWFFCKSRGDRTPGVRSLRLRTTGSFGGLVEGCGREERISRGKGRHGRGPIP